jgi:hypothetical protein
VDSRCAAPSLRRRLDRAATHTLKVQNPTIQGLQCAASGICPRVAAETVNLLASTTAQHYSGAFATCAGPPCPPHNERLNWGSMASAAEARGLFRTFLRQSKHFGTSYNVKE